MGITDNAKNAILSSIRAKAALMVVFDYTEMGIVKMVDRNDVKLTIPAALIAIKETTGLNEDQILIREISKV